MWSSSESSSDCCNYWLGAPLLSALEFWFAAYWLLLYESAMAAVWQASINLWSNKSSLWKSTVSISLVRICSSSSRNWKSLNTDPKMKLKFSVPIWPLFDLKFDMLMTRQRLCLSERRVFYTWRTSCACIVTPFGQVDYPEYCMLLCSSWVIWEGLAA